jgi:hypothetical protein
LSRFILPLVLLLSASAQAALGPKSPPPGWIGSKAEWAENWKRAENVGREAGRHGASADCILAVVLRVIALGELDYTGDALKDPAQGKPTVDLSQRRQYEKSLDEHRDSNCNGPGGGDAATNLDAFVKFAYLHDDWSTERVRRAALDEGRAYLKSLVPNTSPSSQAVDALRGAAGLGVGVGAMGSAGAVPAGFLVAPDPCDVNPRAPFCKQPDGT